MYISPAETVSILIKRWGMLLVDKVLDRWCVPADISDVRVSVRQPG
jgi:hypothetical protein